ncbi:hypothetical protein GCM10022243_67650 [Saccharothrix violaceirubra]|uniref:Phage shock protein A n=1 Tax=Saccharothrix violaceirubra TaxID=413306 RepID=A0A7W7WVG1_9PSEU|nr:hypothetical protein [Saccharothrix violaceirubra]MBB4965285.1 phage shock protein A [Saccharothrix violaceirubra]
MTTPENHDPNVIDAEIVEQPAFTPDYTTDGVPNFDYVRDRIEQRSATAQGSVELAGIGNPEARSLDEQREERDKAARAKLDEIRRSLGQG